MVSEARDDAGKFWSEVMRIIFRGSAQVGLEREQSWTLLQKIFYLRRS